MDKLLKSNGTGVITWLVLLVLILCLCIAENLNRRLPQSLLSMIAQNGQLEPHDEKEF